MLWGICLGGKNVDKKQRKPITFKTVLGPLAIVLMAAIVLMTFTNALLRYTIGTNILSFEEYSRFCFVWICYIGTVIAFEEKRHICVDLISGHLKGKAQHLINLICQLLVVATSSVIFLAGMIYFRRAVTNYSAATHTNMGVVVIGLPLMALCLVYIQLRDMYRMYFKKEVESK